MTPEQRKRAKRQGGELMKAALKALKDAEVRQLDQERITLNYVELLQRAESEATALRAEVERLRAKHEDCNDCELIGQLRGQLAAANALLERAARILDDDVGNDDAGNCVERIRAHLSGQAPTRTDMGDGKTFDAVIVESQRGRTVHLLSDGSSELVARAELARREAKKS